jgi:hypothetical protein
VGFVIKGTLAEEMLFESDAREVGIIRIGLAGSRGVSGKGTVANLRFRAVGDIGSRSPLRLEIAGAAVAGGLRPPVAIRHGEIRIVTAADRVRGDANGNGTVDTGDAALALKMAVKQIPADLVCDMDRDWQVTSVDARILMRMALGKRREAQWQHEPRSFACIGSGWFSQR